MFIFGCGGGLFFTVRFLRNLTNATFANKEQAGSYYLEIFIHKIYFKNPLFITSFLIMREHALGTVSIYVIVHFTTFI